MWEQLKHETSWGRSTISWACMNLGEEGGWALAGGLIAPREKTLVQAAARWHLSGDYSSPSSLTAFVIMRMSSSSALSLALREEDDGKRVGSVTEPDNSFRVRRQKKKKAVIYFVVTRTEGDHVAHSGGTLIMLSEEDGRMLSPSAVTRTWRRCDLACHRPLKSLNK